MESNTRLYVIMARESAEAVIFRRGPSNRVLLISWNRKNDVFRYGQWFKGRIYERRCDLSPQGDYLIYFAAKHKPPLSSWTAVSKPPWLTAILLWPKGNCWGGGGLFEDDRTVLLHHGREEMRLGEGFHYPKGVKVNPLERTPEFCRLLRDGWQFRQYEDQSFRKSSAAACTETEGPGIWEKILDKYRLRMTLKEPVSQAAQPLVDYEILDLLETPVLRLPETDWADWDRNGDLLYSRKGKLYRLENGDLAAGPGKSLLLSDFTHLAFKEILSPPEARQW